jgi:hypothetical protein
MYTPTRVLTILIRVCGFGAFALGLAFWFGYAGSYIQVHTTLGIMLVLSLWALAGIAWRNGVRRDLILFAAVWGGVTWVVGVIQGQILPGASHWIVEVAHLAAGAIAVVIGLFLARAMTRPQIAARGRASSVHAEDHSYI